MTKKSMKIPNLSLVLIAGLAVTSTHAMEKITPAQQNEALGEELERDSSGLKDKALIEQLEKACVSKNFAGYFALLERESPEKQKKLLNVVFTRPKKAIHFIAKHGTTRDLEKFLTIGGNTSIQDRDDQERTPFLSAAKKAPRSSLLLLIEQGANPVDQDKFGVTAFHRAAAGNNTAALTFLKQRGLDINATLSDGFTPLHTAASHGHVDAINILIALGAQTTAVIKGGATALHLAAQQGYTAAVIALIKMHKLDPNAKDDHSRSPLFYAAAFRGNCATARALIENGARTKDERLPCSILHIAAFNNQASMIASLIRDYGLDLHIEEAGMTPLGRAINRRRCLAEFTLLCAGAHLTPLEKTDYRYYDGSCFKPLKTNLDKETMLKALIEGSLTPWDPNAVDNTHGSTALMNAVRCNHRSCVIFLLKDPRTNPNIQDSQQKTALHYFVEQNGNDLNICARLLNLRRTNVGVKDGNGKTARQRLDELKYRGYGLEDLKKMAKLFDLRKMHVQAFLSLKNARCSAECSEKTCYHLPQLPADICFKIVGLLRVESLPTPT